MKKPKLPQKSRNSPTKKVEVLNAPVPGTDEPRWQRVIRQFREGHIQIPVEENEDPREALNATIKSITARIGPNAAYPVTITAMTYDNCLIDCLKVAQRGTTPKRDGSAGFAEPQLPFFLSVLDYNLNVIILLTFVAAPRQPRH